MPKKTIIVEVDEEIELYLKHKLVEVPVRAGQSTKVCLNTSANDPMPGRRVVVELRMLPDGTPEGTQWDLPESPENLYGADEKQWANWPNAARVLFNEVLDATPGATDAIWDLGWHIAVKVADNLARMLKAARSGK
jgi:hypothetical protein